MRAVRYRLAARRRNPTTADAAARIPRASSIDQKNAEGQIAAIFYRDRQR
jgi:hypothetical protein